MASEIDTGLRGFGISISQGRDMNFDEINGETYYELNEDINCEIYQIFN
jgi:hypothetical protein